MGMTSVDENRGAHVYVGLSRPVSSVLALDLRAHGMEAHDFDEFQDDVRTFVGFDAGLVLRPFGEASRHHLDLSLAPSLAYRREKNSVTSRTTSEGTTFTYDNWRGVTTGYALGLGYAYRVAPRLHLGAEMRFYRYHGGTYQQNSGFNMVGLTTRYAL
jgi:hypothetical protein